MSGVTCSGVVCGPLTRPPGDRSPPELEQSISTAGAAEVPPPPLPVSQESTLCSPEYLIFPPEQLREAAP